MSWLFSQALAAEYSRASYSAGKQCAQSKSTGSAQSVLCSDKMKSTLSPSLSGMTSELSTVTPGEELLTWFLAASPAQTFPRQARRPESTASSAVCGVQWQESLAKYDPDTRSWKTRQLSLIEGSEQCSVIWPNWGFLHAGECWDQTMLAPSTPAKDAGSWPTPCHGSSHWGGTFQEVGGSQNKLRGTPIGKLYVNPDFWESLMGWPIGWTGTEPLETAKTLAWQQQHSKSLRADAA